jgi:hypothetical protein
MIFETENDTIFLCEEDTKLLDLSKGVATFTFADLDMLHALAVIRKRNYEALSLAVLVDPLSYKCSLTAVEQHLEKLQNIELSLQDHILARDSVEDWKQLLLNDNDLD